MNRSNLAAVAEWKGIAIVEVSGTVPKVWHGIKYYTDGLTHLVRRNEEQESRGVVEYVGLRNERDAYGFIESMTEAEREPYLSIRRVLEVIGEDEPLIERVLAGFKHGCRFDQHAGIFVVNNPASPFASRNLVEHGGPIEGKIEPGRTRINPRWFHGN